MRQMTIIFLLAGIMLLSSCGKANGTQSISAPLQESAGDTETAVSGEKNLGQTDEDESAAEKSFDKTETPVERNQMYLKMKII